MKRLLLVPCAAAMFAIASINALAGTPPLPTSYTGGSETTATIGLRFDFGDMNPEIVGSVRHTNTNSSNHVTGGVGEISIPLMRGRNLAPTVRLLGTVGSPTVQGLAGAGYDFGNQQLLLSGGVQGPFVEGGLDVQLDGTLHPYLGVNSYNGAKKRKFVPPPPSM